MVIGCRLVCMRIDSSRLSVMRTGLPVRCASSAVCAWMVMSSRPPKAPPLGTSSTNSLSSGIAQHRRDLAAVVEDALALAVEMQPAVGPGAPPAPIPVREQVLDALRLPGAGHDVGRGRERRIDVAALDAWSRRQHVLVPGIDLRRAGLDASAGSTTAGSTS